jgi:uncharacterized membrane protein
MSKKRQLRRAELKRVERRKIMELRRKQRNRKIMMGISVMLIGIISVVIVVSMSNSPNDYDKSNEPVQPLDNISGTEEFRIPLSDVGNNALFYSYNADGVEVRYFAVMGSDGDVHVAFDACDVCYHAKKGYRQNGEVMHCINCGLEYPINSLGTENTAGGCWPSYLPIRINENDVIIQKSDLEQKKWMF